MNTLEQIRQDLTTARKNGEVVKKNLLSVVISECDSKGRDLSEETVITIVKKVYKDLLLLNTKESIMEADILAKSYLSQYLPISYELTKIIVGSLKPINGFSNIGEGMKIVNQHVKLNNIIVDNKIVSELIKEMLIS